MTSVATPPIETEHDRPAWAWRSGPCRALAHDFELFSVAGGEFRTVFEPIIAPFKQREASPHVTPTRYEIVPAPDDEPLDYVLLTDGERLSGGRLPTDLVSMLTWHINRSVIEQTVRSHVLLHSAAAVRAGVTVILPADQESGKTTTCAGLLRDGFDYVTDEAVAIDPVTGWVTPFAKALSLDPGSWPLFPECRPIGEAWLRQWQVPAQSLGARPVQQPVAPPTVVVFPRYVAGARTSITPVSAGEAVRELARMTFHFADHAGRNLAALGRLAQAASAARLTIGSLPDAVSAIDSLVSEKLMEQL